MRCLSTLQQFFGFTRNEAKVIIFLTLTFLVGLGIKWYGATPSEEKAREENPAFDYSKTDSVFLERSKKLEEFTKSLQTKPQARQPKKAEAKQLPKTHSININTATKEELMRLPGIGEAYAERIILHRSDYGPFRSVEDLVAVQGIGKKTLEKLRPFIVAR